MGYFTDSDSDSESGYDSDAETCHICDEREEDACFKTCVKCEKPVCPDCVGITGCQTLDCECQECFNYECESCEGDLDPSMTYLWDGERDSMPLCSKCK